jgi:hypothetical protein
VGNVNLPSLERKVRGEYFFGCLVVFSDIQGTQKFSRKPDSSFGLSAGKQNPKIGRLLSFFFYRNHPWLTF